MEILCEKYNYSVNNGIPNKSEKYHAYLKISKDGQKINIYNLIKPKDYDGSEIDTDRESGTQ